jgi:hypothetical protein
MTSDTVAKLLHEWRRNDRPPDTTWRLPAGTTVIVDEAGMLNTGDLHELTRLADQQHWRLALVGDPHQLQAVGRGGMFAEWCATGRTIELEQIHRFCNDWEAAASLQLRHGDPRGLDAYLDHDRIFAGPLFEHLDNIACAWAGSRERGEYLAITTTTNDHVDAINHAVQAHRDQIGQLGSQRLDIDDDVFCVGDVIATRRNERFLRTSTGDSVRNRDYWTIDAATANGGLAVTRIDGHGAVTLPPAYVREHVQLGYAATEPGNQSDTATGSMTLATPATTCRGLYVAVTRGRNENIICVVTDSHEISDAIDVLQQVLASDRADHPAIRVRRELATVIPPAPRLEPRYTIPDWFDDTYEHARAALARELERINKERNEAADLDQRITKLTARLSQVEPHCRPHDQAIADARRELHVARDRHRRADQALIDSNRLERRAARRHLAIATEDLEVAEQRLEHVTHNARPVLEQRDQMRGERDQLVRRAKTDRVWRQSIAAYATSPQTAEAHLEALNVWKDWANGHDVSPAKLAVAVTALQDDGRPEGIALAEPLVEWLSQRPLASKPPAVTLAAPSVDTPPMEIRL